MIGPSFADKLVALCSFELSQAHNDHDRVAMMIERLAASLALTIAVGTHGDPNIMSDMLEGVTQHLFAEATAKARFAKAMSR